MTKRLFFEAIAKFFAGLVMVSALLFLPAGTVDYPGGWLLIAILFIPMFLAGLVMMAVNPSLLRSRLNAKEKEREQDLVVKLSGLMFLCGFILAGLDFRFGWSHLPFAVNCVGAVLFLTAYVLYAEVRQQFGVTCVAVDDLGFRAVHRQTPAFGKVIVLNKEENFSDK